MTQTLWETEGEWLKCPIHNLDMYYSKYWDQYGCQEIICPFSIGVSKEEIIDYIMGN